MDTLSFQAPHELHQRLEHYAKQRDRSKAYVIRQALEEYLGDPEGRRAHKTGQDSAENMPTEALIRMRAAVRRNPSEKAGVDDFLAFRREDSGE